MRTLRNSTIFLTLILLAFVGGYQFGKNKNTLPAFVTGAQVSTTANTNATFDFSLFWEVWGRLSKFYIDKNALDQQKMMYGAVGGMVNALDDPYTVFLPPQQNKEAKQDLGGKFEGIGAQLGVKEKRIVIIAPLKGAPAEKAGLAPGDWIVKVDGKETSNWTLPETVSKIRGPKGSTVLLTILPRDASTTADIKVERGEITVASVEWEVKQVKCKLQESRDSSGNFQDTSLTCEEKEDSCADCERIAYLKLGRFGDGTTDEWNKTVKALIGSPDYKNNKLKGLIFDLRNNPGGYLKSSVVIASEFLADGVITIQQNADGTKQTFTADKNGRLTTIPMVVLINKGSASASEIVAGALKVRDRASLVGETSFGKGSIQEAQELSAGAGIHITTAKWLLPDGSWINGTGVAPDVTIENDSNSPDKDSQLLKAYSELLK